MPDIEIKRGYEVLPDNNVRFGVRVINNSDFAISDVEVLLDYSESLFEVESNKVQKLGNIPPTVPRTAKFILKPLGCVHKEEIGATVLYKDHQWKKHTEQMRPKEVHCVCPFLKEKSITRADFLRLSNSGYLEERGVNFEGVSVAKLVDFICHTCKNRLYKVDEFPVENGKIVYLAGDAVGEKTYYLLTAVVTEYEGLTQVLLRASSDKSYGLNGFLNEILDNLRHLVTNTSAREIGIIKKEQVINIIDSVVQRSNISMEDGAPSVKIKDSMVQRTELKGDEERKRREEEKLREEREEQERISREREEPVASKEPKGTSWKGFFAVALVLGVAIAGLYLFTSETRTVAISVPYQEPVYETRQVETSVPYQEAVYGTFYSGKIGNYGLTGQTWTIKNAISYTNDYTGKGFWGSEYQLKICWASLNDAVANCQNYYKIQFWDLQPSTIMTGYETKYRTEYKTETYLARYETKYRTEYKQITKARLEWILS